MPFCQISETEFAVLYEHSNVIATHILIITFKNRRFNPFNWSNATNNDEEAINCNYYVADKFYNAVVSNDLSNNISYFHLNCRSLLANFDNINVLLTSLTLKFDIITFSETWLTDETTKFLAYALPGCKLYTVC